MLKTSCFAVLLLSICCCSAQAQSQLDSEPQQLQDAKLKLKSQAPSPSESQTQSQSLSQSLSTPMSQSSQQGRQSTLRSKEPESEQTQVKARSSAPARSLSNCTYFSIDAGCSAAGKAAAAAAAGAAGNGAATAPDNGRAQLTLLGGKTGGSAPLKPAVPFGAGSPPGLGGLPGPTANSLEEASLAARQRAKNYSDATSSGTRGGGNSNTVPKKDGNQSKTSNSKSPAFGENKKKVQQCVFVHGVDVCG